MESGASLMGTGQHPLKSTSTIAAPATASLVTLAERLWRHVAPRRRRQLIGVLLLTILASISEVISIGAVLPFLGALAAPEKVIASPYARPFIDLLSLTHPAQIILPLTVTFCVAGLAAGALRIVLLRVSLKLAFSLGADLSNEAYRRTLYQPYAVHIARNSSEIITGISNKTAEVIFYVLMPTLNLFSSMVIAMAIVGALCAVIPLAALASFGVFGVLYALLVKQLRRRLQINSEQIAREQSNVIKYLQEGLGGIRDILIDGTQEAFSATFRKSDAILRSAQGSNQFISQSPRFVMESAGMVLIAVIAYGLSQSATGVANVIPMLAALALGLQRLLPALQQGYQSWSTIHGAKESLRGALALLDQPVHARSIRRAETLPFSSEIKLRNVSFQYNSNTPWILRGLNLTIPKGGRIGFVGATGSGKSTLLDIIMGLLTPSRGEMLIDDVPLDADNLDSWRTHVAHVPQSIFLSDNSVLENIAFGVPLAEIDHESVHAAAHLAQIGTTIESLPAGYKTLVGERGVQLSGGQRQRIGIARALYKKADVMVFDEATSALDGATEEAVMAAIEALSGHVTVLLIAHRLSTLRNCSHVIEISKIKDEEITSAKLKTHA
jgi:ATP-binding cassette subfamily B protein